jgi:hypothetical protein
MTSAAASRARRALPAEIWSRARAFVDLKAARAYLLAVVLTKS